MSPVLSGIIGSIIAAAVCGWWLRRRPFPVSKSQQKSLVKRYKFNIRLGNALFIVPLAIAIYLFSFGVVANNDWRYGLLLIGLALGLPLFAAFVPSAKHGVNFKEAILAISVKQKTPVALMLSINLFGCAMALVGLYPVAT